MQYIPHIMITVAICCSIIKFPMKSEKISRKKIMKNEPNTEFYFLKER
jgi:hypothetical protein